MTTIARTAAIRALTTPHDGTITYNIRYVRRDGSIGQKLSVSSQRKIPRGKTGLFQYRYSLKNNYCILLYDHATHDFFTIKSHLLTHFNNFPIDHTK